MKIRTRLVLLLGCLIGVFGLSVAALQLTHHHESRTILASLEKERSDLVDRLLALTGESLKSFASDYSLWDEMVGFVQSGNTGWAAINIDPSLPNFNAQAAWVVRADGTLLYTARTGGTAAATLPLADPDFMVKLRAENSLHFYQASPAGLLEVRTGPVLPSDDLQRVQAARGWFIVARLWDQNFLQALGSALQSRVTVGPPDTATGQAPVIRLQRVLTDWRGLPVQTLQLEYESQPLAELLASNKDEALLLYAFGAVIILVVVISLSRWVLRPLHRLGLSLETGQSAPLAELQQLPDEFGHLARQVAQSFVQRDALRTSEELQRQSLDLRSRLARDLHDGIIQSVYAAGLGLESARNLRGTDPAAADQRLATCQQMLNDTLWQVRNFIETLEPETEAVHSPGQSLAALAASMQKLQAIPITADLDPALTGRIGPHQELHLLQMARELLSNALRHSGAQEVRLALQTLPEGRAELVISDNGRGFDPALSNGGGRGLINLASRARDFGADLRIDSAPGKGARITVQFSPMP